MSGGNGSWDGVGRLEVVEHKVERALDQAETNWARLQVLDGQMRSDREMAAQTLALVRAGAHARDNISAGLREQARMLHDLSIQVGEILNILRGENE